MTSSSNQNGNDTTSRGRMLSDRAREVIGRLGGDPDAPPATPDTTPEVDQPASSGNHDSHTAPPLTASQPPPNLDLPTLGYDDIAEAPPGWLEAFLSEEIEVEALAERLAQTIREDPRFMRTAWWQRLLQKLIACTPGRLIAMAESLVVARDRLEHVSSSKSGD